jgi:small conductance mechanosensitive channel
MGKDDLTYYQELILNALSEFGLKVLAALAFWVFGRWLIGALVSVVRRSLERQKVDPTVLRYLGSAITVTLNVLLVIAILGYFGLQTTTFAALIAAAGVAIGVAWSGLLAHFAAGALMIVLRPIKVGDFVTIGGITGTVTELGLFATTLNTADNIQVVIGNNKVLGDTIHNYSHNAYRRVDLQCQLADNADLPVVVNLIKEKVSLIPNVLQNPAVEVAILENNLLGPLLAVRPSCHNEHYWQVYFDTNSVLRDELNKAGVPAPVPGQRVWVTQN